MRNMNSLQTSMVMSSYENTGATRHDPSVTTTSSTTTSVSVCSSSPTFTSPVAFISEESEPASTTISSTPPRSYEPPISLLAPPAAPRKRHESQVQVSRSQASSVRRCLFGRPDPAETRHALQTQLAEINQDQSERYNFDFEAGLPLPSTTSDRYEWTPSSGETCQRRAESSVVKAEVSESGTKQSVIQTSETQESKTTSSEDVIQVTAAGSSVSTRQPSTLMDHLPVISKPRTSSSRMPSHAAAVKRAHEEPTTSKDGRRAEQEVTSTSLSHKRMRISSAIATCNKPTTSAPSSSSSEEDC